MSMPQSASDHILEAADNGVVRGVGPVGDVDLALASARRYFVPGHLLAQNTDRARGDRSSRRRKLRSDYGSRARTSQFNGRYVTLHTQSVRGDSVGPTVCTHAFSREAA